MVKAFVAGALVVLATMWVSPGLFATDATVRAGAPAKLCRCPVGVRGPCVLRLARSSRHLGYVCAPARRLA